MSYTPTEWETADIVTATRMNALEQAVGDMNMSYTPNVWSDGDILSAEKMNALEQAVAGGGGGGSDFSTATMTVTNTVEDSFVNLTGVFVNTQADELVPDYGCGYGTTTVIVVLYGDNGSIVGIDAEEITSTTGDITVEDFNYIVTGDCTVTAKGYLWG